MAVSRFEAEQGDVVRLRVFSRRNGALFDPFSINKVEIRRTTSATTSDLVATLPDTAVVQEAQGVFYVDWPIPADELVGSYIDRWYFERDAGDPEETDDAHFAVLPEGSVTPSVGSYITVDEIKSKYLPGTLLTDADIAVLIQEGRELVEMYTGQTFGGGSASYDIDGTGKPWLILPDTILSLISISSICGAAVTEYDLTKFAINGRWIISKAHMPYPFDRCGVQQVVCGCDGGGIFPLGQKNIHVTGTFGLYPDVPLLIRRMNGLFVMHAGQDDSRTGPAANNFDSESVEQYSYSLRELGERIRLKGSTGIVEIDHIGNLFRRNRGRVAVM